MSHKQSSALSLPPCSLVRGRPLGVGRMDEGMVEAGYKSGSHQRSSVARHALRPSRLELFHHQRLSSSNGTTRPTSSMDINMARHQPFQRYCAQV